MNEAVFDFLERPGVSYFLLGAITGGLLVNVLIRLG